MEYKTCEEQLRYIWPFGTGCGRMKLPALTFTISLLCNLYCQLVRHIHVRLRHYATNRQVVGPIPDGVIGIFQ